jgi:hypothetical protein
MKRIMIAAAVAALAGCVSTGPIPIGEDTFMISKKGAGGGFTSVGAIKGEVFQEANAYCVSQGKKFQVVSTNEHPAGFGRFPEAEVQFMCLNQGDPALTRTRLQRAPDTIIEMRK